MSSKVWILRVDRQIREWLRQVVIGLNLCPFAARPLRDNTLRIRVVSCEDEASLLRVLLDEIKLLRETPAREMETTLLVLTDMLADFHAFNQFLDLSDALLAERGLRGEFQIATFHPQYCFAGVPPESPENLTNRSPYPVLHILREATLERALAGYPSPEDIPRRNIERMLSLSVRERRNLFPYLFSK